MILEPREKIAFLRKKYNITQKELGQEEFSKSYIASLENGQRDLSEENLKFLCNRFNIVLKEKNIDDLVDFNWLKRSFLEEKEIFFQQLLKEILEANSLELLENSFRKLEEFKEIMNIEEKSLFFHNLAYKFMVFKQNKFAYEVYNSIYLIFNEIQDSILLGKIINNFLVIMKDIRIFNRFKNIIDLYESRDIVLEKRIKVYIIDSLIEISYYLADYEKEYYFLKKLEDLCSYKKGKILILNRLQLLIDFEKLNEAKKLYKKIREDIFFDKYKKNLDLIALELFIKLKKKSELKLIFTNISLEEGEKNDSNKNLILAKTGLYLKKRDEAVTFYEAYIDSIFVDELNSKNKIELYNAIKYLLQSYKKNQIKKVEKIFLKILSLEKGTANFSMVFLILHFFVENKFYEKYLQYDSMIIKRIEETYGN